MNLKPYLIRSIEVFLLWPFQRLVQRDVMIVANTGNRDVLGQLWVAAILKQKYGLRVFIHSTKNFKSFWLFLFRPKVVVHVMIDCDAALQIYESIVGLGSRAIVSPTEVVAWSGAKNFVAKQEYKHLIEGILFSGRAMANLMVKNKKINQKQALLVGYPTLDWTKKPLSKLFMDNASFRKSLGIVNNNKIVFVASSFSMADLSTKNWEMKNWRSSKSEAEVMIKSSLFMRKKTILYLKKLAEIHPDWNIVVKCHPFEKRGVYESEFVSYGNISTIDDWDIHDVLVNSDVLIHWNSTTAVQAWGLDMPTVLLDFEESKKFVQLQGGVLNSMRKGNYIANDFDGFENAIIESLNEKIPISQLKARAAYTSKWFGKTDGKSGFAAAKAINKIYLSNKDNEIKFRLSLSVLQFYLPKIVKYYLKWNLFKLSGYRWKELSTMYDNFSLEKHSNRFWEKLITII